MRSVSSCQNTTGWIWSGQIHILSEDAELGHTHIDAARR